jgi:hypothetical protein
MAGLAPAIHVFVAARKNWMLGTGPGMTEERRFSFVVKCSKAR